MTCTRAKAPTTTITRSGWSQPENPGAALRQTYFDERTGKYRIKSRYKRGCWCPLAGILIGFVLALLFQ